MPDVFISYSRRDGEVVSRLAEALESRGKDVWIDVTGIRDAEVFPAALRRAVEASDGFVFVITPASVASRYCTQEVEHAAELNKRIVPVLVEVVPDEAVPEGLKDKNWITLSPETLEEGVDRIAAALDRDLEWTRQHTRWLAKTLEWEAEGKDRSFLLRGAELAAAEQWLGAAETKDPAPTDSQRTYVQASRAAATRRARSLVTMSAIIAVVSLALLAVALVSRQQAIDERTLAKSRALAAQSQVQLDTDPELSLLLARDATRTSATPEALFALRGALDVSRTRGNLSKAGGACRGQALTVGPGVAFDPGHGRIVLGTCTGEIRFLDASTYRVERRIPVGRIVSAVALSRDKRRLLAGTERGIVLLDPKSRRILGRSQRGQVRRLQMSHEGELAVVQIDARFATFRLSGGPLRYVGAPNDYFAAAWGPRQQLFLGAVNWYGGAKQGVHVIDGHSGRETRVLMANRNVSAVAVDGTTLAVASESPSGASGIVTLWDIERWRSLGKLAEFDLDLPARMAFSAGGDRLAIGMSSGALRVWSVPERREIASLAGHATQIWDLAFDPDGDELISSSVDGATKVWRGRGEDDVAVSADVGLGDVAIDNDRLTTLSGGAVVETWRSTDGRRATRMDLAGEELINPPALSPDGRLAAISGSTSMIVWNVRRQQVADRLPADENAWFTFDEGSTRLAVLGDRLYVANLAGGPAVELHGRAPVCSQLWTSAEFSRDGRRLAGLRGCGKGAIWDARSGRLLHQLSDAGTSEVALSPDGSQAAMAGAPSGQVTIWRPGATTPTHMLIGHTSFVSDIEFSPGGDLLATGGTDGTMRIWDVQTGRLLRVRRTPSPVIALSFDGTGTRIATRDTAGIARIWDVCSACGDQEALLRLADRRATRELSPAERNLFLD